MLALGVAVFYAGGAAANGVVPYVESFSSNGPRSQAGLALERSNMRLKANVTVAAEGPRTRAQPRMSSAFALGRRLDLETHLGLADWNSDLPSSQATFDTRVRLRAPFLEPVEGRIWQTPEGERQSLKLGFSEDFGRSLSAPLTFSSRATYEQSTRAGRGAHDRRVGVETVIAGFMPRRFGGEERLSLRVEQRADTARRRNASVAYDHAFRVYDAINVGLNFRVLEAAESVEPGLGLSWQATF
jgi:hypothetical protein